MAQSCDDWLHMAAQTPAVFFRCGSALATATSRLASGAHDVFAIATPPAAAMIMSNMVGWSCSQSTGTQRSQWISPGASLALASMRIAKPGDRLIHWLRRRQRDRPLKGGGSEPMATRFANILIENSELARSLRIRAPFCCDIPHKS
jgi:hypothetical protein